MNSYLEQDTPETVKDNILQIRFCELFDFITDTKGRLVYGNYTAKIYRRSDNHNIRRRSVYSLFKLCHLLLAVAHCRDKGFQSGILLESRLN